MTGANTSARVRLDDREALHEMLVASVTLSMQLEEPDVAEHVLDALRSLHRDARAVEDEGNVGFT